MYRKRLKMNGQGFTLVEVIASIAILGLVVISLMPYFPQVLSWSKETDDQLVTSHLLSQVAYDLKEDLISEDNRTLKSLVKGNLPFNKRSLTEVRKHASETGMTFLVEDGLDKIIQGLTTMEEILQVSISDRKRKEYNTCCDDWTYE